MPRIQCSSVCLWKFFLSRSKALPWSTAADVSLKLGSLGSQLELGKNDEKLGCLFAEKMMGYDGYVMILLW